MWEPKQDTQDPAPPESTVHAFDSELTRRMTKALEFSRGHQGVARRAQKMHYDELRRPKKVKFDDLIFHEAHTLSNASKGISGKLWWIRWGKTRSS